MKKIFTKLILIILLGLLFIRCDKDKDELIHMEGYIVGYDPCTVRPPYNRSKVGYIIISEDLKDTLTTYSLSDNGIMMPAIVVFNSDTLYEIPALYFNREWPFFSETLRYKYGVKISYSIPNENEIVFLACTTDIIRINFDQIIIKSATKN